MSDFEKWFAAQDFYTNMRFIHGDALFHKDSDVYRILPVQMTYLAWSEQRQRTKDKFVSITQEWHTKGWDARQEEVDQLQKRIDAVKAIMNEYYTGSFDESAEMAGLISLALRGAND